MMFASCYVLEQIWFFILKYKIIIGAFHICFVLYYLWISKMEGQDKYVNLHFVGELLSGSVFSRDISLQLVFIKRNINN